MVDERNEIIISESANPETTWDGDAWTMPNGGLVRICLSPSTSFPLVWDNRRHYIGHFSQHFTQFKSKAEMFLYLSAHRLRLLWQFEQPIKMSRIANLLRIDSGTDADIYALRVLSRYRHNPAEITTTNPEMQIQPTPQEKI